ncbi:LOW QUALITY PROTEIN: nuclear pore complex protein Nup160-like [Haliotis rubra]|uniref:LOW QUALITY PROTEIN: nuclear pore complex protein Nup160-like n=1 Tax=Haliotis rubra TaxID=36100 RepID=UPI001EE5480C|nr:LOW QUALITY PROTEIN: nuclear pore complex protein Nup160-like [Haliotis rubra]
MAESLSTILHREVVVTASTGVRWKEITVYTGASASTLQDIKVPESCGGYCYRDVEGTGLENSPVRNRFIYWRANDDTLELVEQSLDVNLSGNHVRYRFQDTPILNGISVHEARNSLVILVPTVASVHRLVFPHPLKLDKREARFATDTSPLSIFYDATVATATDAKNMHMLNPSGSITAHLLTAATHVTSDGEALFVLATDAGGIIQVKMPAMGVQGVVQQHELSQSSMMQKLWNGLVPVLIRGVQQDAGTATGIVIHSIHGEDFIFCVCRDHKLRMWSAKTRECILAYNLLDFLSSRDQSLPPVTSTSGHVIKKVINPKNNSFQLCVHLTFPDQNQFCLVKPVYNDSRFHIQHQATVFGPLEDLVDYCVTSDKLYTLWTSQSGRQFLEADSDDTESWVEVLLQPQEVADILIPSFRDPRDVYLERIFHPGRFSSQDLLKALNNHMSSPRGSCTDVPWTQVCRLRVSSACPTYGRRLSAAVESEIRNCALDVEMQEEDYYQLQLEQWSKFYSCCIQYQEVGAKVKGLFSDSVTGLVCLIRKSQLSSSQLPTDDWSLGQDVMKLCECVRDISNEMTEELSTQFHTEAGMFESPEDVVSPMVDALFFPPGGDSLLATDVGDRLEEIHNLVSALRVLLKILDLSNQEEDFMLDDSAVDASRQLSCSQLFTSSSSSAILAVCLEQMCTTRLSFCRDLLVLQVAAIKLGDQHGLRPDVSSVVREDLIPLTASLIQSYLLLVWASQSVVIGNQNTALEFNVRQLAALEISDTTNVTSSRSNLPSVTLAELFIQGVGGAQGRSMLAQIPSIDYRSKAVWAQHLVPLVRTLAKIIWPMCDNFLFPEFLVGSCQYLHLQEYVRLLSSWCEWNVASRRFLLGLCYLHFDEPQKAAQCFTQAGSGVGNETFLSQKLLQTDEDEFHKMEVLYYLKVIRQFEEFNLPDMVIQLAKTAIGAASEEDENLATLWSKVFKYHLELGHNEDAYGAMIANPEPSRRKDCLRQLLVVLCERGDLQALVEFPYIDLQDEVVNILESRARSVDLVTHNYYNLLYSFHIYRNNFRKAGHVMYEHGMRLGRELPGLKGLQRQAQCYLASLNALRLVRPEYAWIVKPVSMSKYTEQVSDDDEEPGISPKHGLDGAEKEAHSLTRKMEIMELVDIEKEYILVDARLRLIRRNPDPSLASGPTPGPDEMVGLLVNSGLFDRAIIVAKYFNLTLNTVFENLALRCVHLAKGSNYFMIGDNDQTSEAWDWLQENHFNAGTVQRDKSAADQAWTLLQSYLSSYEDNTTRYHRCVSEKLLSHGFALPTWFINTYKELNCAELLRVYIDYDLLEEAAALATEYIHAVTDTLAGVDRIMFDLKGCRLNAQCVWLPYVCIDQLLAALHDHQEQITYKKIYEDLKQTVTRYQDRVERDSRDLSRT